MSGGRSLESTVTGGRLRRAVSIEGLRESREYGPLQREGDK